MRAPLSHLPLWFGEAPPYERDARTDDPRWRRRQTVGTGLWVLDERLVPVPDEPIEHVMGSAPSWVLDPLEEAGVAFPESFRQLTSRRDRPCSEITALGTVCLVTFDGAPALGLWWRRDGHTLFATWWDGWLTSGLRPTDADHAVRLEETLG